MEEPECKCGCCTVEPRRPAEVHDEVVSKCSALSVSDTRSQELGCPDACSVINDMIFEASRTVELERFCFYHCQPSEDSVAMVKALEQYGSDGRLDTECVPSMRAAASMTRSDDGNGRDAQVPPAIRR